MHPQQIRRAFLLFAVLVSTAATPALSQTGGIQGRAVDVETGQPLASASVEVVTGAGRVMASALTGDEGRFHLTGLQSGTYAVVVKLIGYQTARVDGVEVVAGQTADVTAELRSDAFRLNPVVVTASKRQEKVLDAPAAVTIVPTEDIQERPAITAVDHVRALPGVDIASTGLMQSNVVARGFNNVFSGALLMLTDNRLANVPSLRVNAAYLIPMTSQDIERIEVVLGPGAALYGPNSSSGVMHIITRSPFDSEGTTLSVAGGARAGSAPAGVAGAQLPEDDAAILHVSGRHAQVISEQWAYKVSGQFFQGSDWQFADPAEVAARRQAIEAGADPATLRIGDRDFTASRWAGEARVDFRPDDRTEAIFSVGATTALSGIEMTGLGSAQAQDWRYMYYQARFRRDRFFAQAFLNTSDAGETYLLRTGQPIRDNSRMFVAQVQHGFDWGDRQSFIYGADYLLTQPRTDSTITGRREDEDQITEYGAYLHSETRLSDHFDFVAALRLDHHSHIEDLILSPRAALVFKPTETQNFRVTYNRAFSTPTTNNLFLDLSAGAIPIGPGVSYDIRAFGVPSEGLHFGRDCAGGAGSLCMRSPFVPGSRLPADASLFWDVAVAVARDAVLAATGVDLAQIPAPAPGQIATDLRRLNTTELYFEDVSPSDVVDIEPIQPTISNTFEVGYKGLLGNRLMLSADGWYEMRKDFVGPLIVETPTVFFDRTSLAAYLSQYIDNAIYANAIASNLAGLPASTTTTGLPLGTILPDNPMIADDAMILTYRNFGEVDLWGADFAAQLLLGDRWSLTGSYSFVSDDYFDKEEVGGGSDVALNAPAHKASLGAQFRDESRGLNAEVRGRYTAGFPMNSGVFIGDVEPYTLFDATIGYQLPFAPGTTATLSVQNILNDMHQEFVGAPQIGRVALLRVQHTF